MLVEELLGKIMGLILLEGVLMVVGDGFLYWISRALDLAKSMNGLGVKKV